MATETQKPTDPKPEVKTLNPLDLNQVSSKSEENPHSSVDGNGISKGLTTGAVSPTGGSGNDIIQKKMKRAERFGVPVLMSEQEKRNSRSQRFGTGMGPKVSKSAEEQKRKARAERFGISVPADEGVKKKSRAERFGSDTKVSDVEEEKRKARALRFSHPNATAVFHSNGNSDSALKTATVDNAGGGA